MVKKTLHGGRVRRKSDGKQGIIVEVKEDTSPMLVKVNMVGGSYGGWGVLGEDFELEI